MRAGYRLPWGMAASVVAGRFHNIVGGSRAALEAGRTYPGYPVSFGSVIDALEDEHAANVAMQVEAAKRQEVQQASDRKPNRRQWREHGLHVISCDEFDLRQSEGQALAWQSFGWRGRRFALVTYASFPLAVPPGTFGPVRFHNPDESCRFPRAFFAAPRSSTRRVTVICEAP